MLRGRPVSFSTADILKEMDEVYDRYRPSEVVLSGTNIMEYNSEGKDLADVIRVLAERYDMRIRMNPSVIRKVFSNLDNYIANLTGEAFRDHSSKEYKRIMDAIMERER